MQGWPHRGQEKGRQGIQEWALAVKDDTRSIMISLGYVAKQLKTRWEAGIAKTVKILCAIV